ncbi:F-box protein, partial [Trifolium medium]|nr:F-box protein [Trifolium medium]
EAWDILVKCYEGGEKVKNVKLQALRRQYEVLEIEKNDSIGEYVSKVQGLLHTMKNCGETITDRMVIEKEMEVVKIRANVDEDNEATMASYQSGTTTQKKEPSKEKFHHFQFSKLERQGGCFIFIF